jgi:hypothetical protein
MTNGGVFSSQKPDLMASQVLAAAAAHRRIILKQKYCNCCKMKKI